MTTATATYVTSSDNPDALERHMACVIDRCAFVDKTTVTRVGLDQHCITITFCAPKKHIQANAERGFIAGLDRSPTQMLRVMHGAI
jgi:hypothetical protein